jgi:DtxR family Mn-dependent transcriptional regulator
MLDVKPPSVTEMLQKLSEKGLLEYKPYRGALLTDKGVRLAKKLTRKHRIFETFLGNVVGAPPEQAHKQACDMEHSLSDEAEKALCKMMGNPQICADDEQPIPDCDNDCEKCLKENGVLPLSELEEDSDAVITYVSTANKIRMRKLVSMGFIPKRRIRLLEIAPLDGPFIVDIGDGVVAFGREYAENIFVEEV